MCCSPASRQPEHLRTCAPDTAGEMALRIIWLRPFDCRAAGKDARTATRSLTPQIAGLESCALRLRSVDNERGHSQGYLGELRSRSRVDSATALLIWNGQSENRQRCSAALNPQSMISMPWQLDAPNQAGGQEMHGAEAALRKRLDEKGCYQP